MGKKEFYETYIKDNRTEDEKMMDIIHENARKSKNDKIYVASKKKRKKGDLWLSRGIMVVDLMILVVLTAMVVKICLG